MLAESKHFLITIVAFITYVAFFETSFQKFMNLPHFGFQIF